MQVVFIGGHCIHTYTLICVSQHGRGTFDKCKIQEESLYLSSLWCLFCQADGRGSEGRVVLTGRQCSRTIHNVI